MLLFLTWTLFIEFLLYLPKSVSFMFYFVYITMKGLLSADFCTSNLRVGLEDGVEESVFINSKFN